VKVKIGDLVQLTETGLLGVVVGVGEQKRRLYGDGIEYTPYVDVRWFDAKYGKRTRRFTPPDVSLVVVSEA
jgi:hypothetical protein